MSQIDFPINLILLTNHATRKSLHSKLAEIEEKIFSCFIIRVIRNSYNILRNLPEADEVKTVAFFRCNKYTGATDLIV